MPLKTASPLRRIIGEELGHESGSTVGSRDKEHPVGQVSGRMLREDCRQSGVGGSGAAGAGAGRARPSAHLRTTVERIHDYLSLQGNGEKRSRRSRAGSPIWMLD